MVFYSSRGYGGTRDREGVGNGRAHVAAAHKPEGENDPKWAPSKSDLSMIRSESDRIGKVVRFDRSLLGLHSGIVPFPACGLPPPMLSTPPLPPIES